MHCTLQNFYVDAYYLGCQVINLNYQLLNEDSRMLALKYSNGCITDSSTPYTIILRLPYNILEKEL